MHVEKNGSWRCCAGCRNPQRMSINANPNVNLKHIGAKSSDGIVTLVGNVTDPNEIEEARDSASKARGVTKVESQVKVQEPEMQEGRPRS